MISPRCCWDTILRSRNAAGVRRLNSSNPVSTSIRRRTRILLAQEAQIDPGSRLLSQPNLSIRTIHTHNNDIRTLPWQFLRASDTSCFDSSTGQRTDVSVDNATGKLILDRDRSTTYSIKEVSMKDENNYNVLWNDGLESIYSADWVERQLHRWHKQVPETRVLWKGLNEDTVRKSSEMSISFQDLLKDSGRKKSIQSLYRYGILLVTGTPVDDNGAGVAALGAALGGGSNKTVSSTSLVASYREGSREIMLPHGTDGPLRTLYGTVWSTSSAGQAEGASVADSAYSQDGLPLHTDMTYMRDPPGLQIFTMIEPATSGGESIFGDGFAAAEELRRVDRASFDLLSNLIRRYRSTDYETGWHFEASGRVIELRDGEISSIRHNDLDRLPDLPPSDLSSSKDIDQFYEDLAKAHLTWDSILSDDEFRLVVELQPGDTMVVANQVRIIGQ